MAFRDELAAPDTTQAPPNNHSKREVRTPNNHSKREVPASLVQASASLAHQALYLCGKPFDSSHFDAIAEAD